MRHYKVTLAVVAVQRKLCIFGAMLRATWCALRGWETLLASRSRIPVTRWVLEALVLAGLVQGLEEQGRHRREWWASALGWWLAFESPLRPL